MWNSRAVPSTWIVAALVLSCAIQETPSSTRTLSLLLTLPGETPTGELGFRFGSPRDVDGDGVADIVGGARFTNLQFTQMGTVTVWSSATGSEIAHWNGERPDALFGHAVLVGPDVDGDGLADIVASAPTGRYERQMRGVVSAHSAITGRALWTLVGEPAEGLGWDLALTEDQNGDGVEDFFAGAPAARIGKVYLISTIDRSTLQTFQSGVKHDRFGWYVAATGDLDGDGHGDLLVGAPQAKRAGEAGVGAAYAFSSATAERLHVWRGRRANSAFGEMAAGLPDIDGDGVGDVAIAAPHRAVGRKKWYPGEVFVFSGASDDRIHHWVGEHDRELYGRMLAHAGDVDGDGVADLAIGAPWSRVAGMEEAGRFEVRSGRTGDVVAEVQGSRPNLWLGWHIAAGENLGQKRERGLVVSTLLSTENGISGAGALRVYVMR